MSHVQIVILFGLKILNEVANAAALYFRGNNFDHFLHTL